MARKKKWEDDEEINGLSPRHVAQIIRRKMIQKNHGDKKKFKRKDRTKSEDYDYFN